MGKSLIQPPIKINFYYGRYLSSGCVMDGPAFTPWQDDGLWMPAAPCRGRSRTQQRWHQSNYCPPHHGNGGREVEERWGQRGGGVGGVPHTHTCTSFHPSLLTVLLRHRHKVTRAMKAVRALMIGHRWMNGHMAGWQMDTFICKLPEKQMSQMQMSFLTKMFNDFFLWHRTFQHPQIKYCVLFFLNLDKPKGCIENTSWVSVHPCFRYCVYVQLCQLT